MSDSIFNNPEIVANGWYLVCPSHALAQETVQSFDLCGQRLAFFRGKTGQVWALDAYCPHLGTDLTLGKVEGDQVRCFFHHWAFDGTGQCRDIPCQSQIPPSAKLQSHATEEKYGFIWVYPDTRAPVGVAEFTELQDQEVMVQADRPLQRRCHHHICMVNGIDVQHLNTVHHLSVSMELALEQDMTSGQINFTLTGKLPQSPWYVRLGQCFLGDTYTYSMGYAHGCLGLLTMMQNVRLIPPLHMLYAYLPLDRVVPKFNPFM
jgi:phenylpropionate dioxygenase-like ring-hydroxylating dioxygenase large terminal subunit